MTSEEKKIFDGVLFKPGDPELRQIKLRSHNLCAKYNRTTEDEVEYRAQLLEQILGGMGKGVFMQGPIFFHYGTHTTIGDKFFGNYNLTIQDDGKVTIGNNVNFGYALPVTIGNNVWFGANVTVCGGVTIGDNCVIGAGSVVTRDIPAGSLAAGVPCKVIRPITEADSMVHKPEILADNHVIGKD